MTAPDDRSSIHYTTNGATMLDGPDAVGMFAAYSLATALKLYGNHGIKASRMHTPKNMMAKATEITGLKFKSRDYLKAAEAVKNWADTMKAALPKTLDGKPIA